MEQPSSGLSAPSAYDLACRYNSLFQYSPAAAAACAAAYNMFGSSKSAPIGSSNSPFQPLGSIATSSLPSSSSSNLTSSPTSSLSSLLSTKPTVVEQHDANNAKTNGNQSYENVSENGSASDNDNDNEEDEDDAEHNCSRVSSSFEEKDEDKNDVDVQKVQEQLSAEAHKSIASCLDQLAECANDEEESGKKAEEHSIGSLMNTLAKRSNLNVDLNALRKNLIDSVSQAIESTLDSFVKQDAASRPPPHHSSSVKHKSSDDELKRVEPAPKRIRVNEKIAKNSMNNSQNFNVSKILSKDTSKRKMAPVCDAFSAKPPLAHQSLLTAHNLNGKQAHLSTFYSAAAMSHLPPPPAGYNGLAAPIASSASSTASNASTNSSISSLFANHQHQLLMAAAHAHAASGQNSTNYLQMAAAANRLFTPYLLDQQHKPSGAYTPTTNGMFHSSSAHKRRRTKVTDTRLSPRNPLSRVLNGKARDQSPNNDHDDDNDYDDEQHQHNQEDDSASSGCNESGSTNGSNCRITTTVYSNNVYDINTDNTEYTGYQTSTLSSLHLRKAKLMFFFSRYPSSTILRNYFPDVKFNKANTAQLVKWFSNFREFFYIQMEKYARQHLAEGMRSADDILVDCDSEIFRALNSHYNRNNQLEIPASFCFVIQATLREFFKAIQDNKDMDPSWKKAIYKIIARMDDQIPEYFKSVQWMESLETNI